MAVDEQALRIRRSLEEKLGVQEVAYLIGGRPTGGWDALVTKEHLDERLLVTKEHLDERLLATKEHLDERLLATKEHLDERLLATKEYVDLRLEALEQRLLSDMNLLRVEFRDQTTRQLKWIVPTVFAGMSVSSALIAGAFATLA
jgi:hypothetical protein